jgi:hypothetical protein
MLKARMLRNTIEGITSIVVIRALGRADLQVRFSSQIYSSPSIGNSLYQSMYKCRSWCFMPYQWWWW